METGQKTKECSHYGIDYVLTVHFTSDTLTVSAEEKQSSFTWRGSFPADYIEEVTRKTGNYKRFPVYVKMLQAAMDCSSKSVLLELVSHQQMDALRAKKRSQPCSTRCDSRLYLILTYAVEFDKVHYPLPLAQEELTPSEQSQVIRQLRLQVESLKRLIPPQSLTAIELVSENARLREELTHAREGNSSDCKVVALQQELETAKSKTQKQVAYLQKVNSDLRSELDKAKRSIDDYLSEIKDRGDGKTEQELRTELEEAREELQTTKEELKRFRDLYEESEQTQGRLRAALQNFQSDLQDRYEQTPEEEPESVRSSHRRLFQEDSDPDDHFSPRSTQDIDLRMQKIRDLLQRQAII